MKLHTLKMSAGLTLIEVTLVVAVLLILISVLFIGMSAYSEGTNRAQCILNISNVQKAMRAYQHMYELIPGVSSLPSTSLIGTHKFLEVAPDCKSGGVYTYATIATPVGTAYLTCSYGGGTDHAPKSTTGW